MEGMDGIAKNLHALRARLMQQAHDAAGASGHLLASYAKQIAPWQDRSKRLRQEIAFETEVTTAHAQIWIFHSATYAPFVEAGTRRSRPYPSLWPSVAANTDNVLGIFKRHMAL